MIGFNSTIWAGRSKWALLLAIFFFAMTTFAQAPDEKMVFSDEFIGPAGSQPDPSKWVREIGGGGWGNKELEYYTDSSENSSLDGEGFLVIKAVKLAPSLFLSCWYGPCKYTSARLKTKGKFDLKYGRFEAKIKIPKGQGVWPAFWLLGSNIDTVGWPRSGEIDIARRAEGRRQPGRISEWKHAGQERALARVAGRTDDD